MKKSYEREKLTFLACLRLGQTVSQAAEASGVSRRTWYDIKDREPSFSAEWDYVVNEANEKLLGEYEAELRERALDRNDTKSHTLLMFLLRKLDPAYRDNYKTETKITHETVKEISFNKEEIETGIKILEEALSKSPQPVSSENE